MYNNNNNYFGNQYPGTMYNMNQRPQPKMTQGLSKEELSQLRKKDVNFTLKPDPVEMLKSKCTHKDAHSLTLINNGDGTMTCSLCGETFPLIDDLDTAQEITNNFVGLLQTIKAYFLDMPENYTTDLFRIIPVVKKMPMLFNHALRNFLQYNGAEDLHMNRGSNAFDVLNSMATGAPNYGMNYGGAPQYGQPQYAQPPVPNYGGAPQNYGGPAYGQPPINYGAAPQAFNPAPVPNYGGAPGNGMPPVQPGQGYGRNPLTEDGGTAIGYGAPAENKVEKNETIHTTKQFRG